MKPDFLSYNEWLLIESVSTNYLQLETNDRFYNLGSKSSLSKTLFESNGLILENASYVAIDDVIVTSLMESLVEGQFITESFIGKVKDTIHKGLEYAADVKSEFVRVGDIAIQSMNGVLDKLGKILNSLYDSVKKFLEQTWSSVTKEVPKIVAKVKEYVKQAKTDQINSLISVVEMSKGTEELEEATKDIKGSVKKISGAIPFRVSDEEKEKLKKGAQDIRRSDDDLTDVEHKAEEFLEIRESDIRHIMSSLNGFLISENQTIDAVLDQLNEKRQIKSVYAWALEAIGFILSPFGKAVEYLIKNGLNFILNTLSVIHRGLKDAYKYLIIGTIAGLIYHIVHSVGSVAEHSAHTWEQIKDLVEKGEFSMKSLVDISSISLQGIGIFMMAVFKVFMPTVGWVMEQVLIAAATFELLVAICELGDAEKKASFCSVILNAEHRIESLIKGEEKGHHPNV